MKGYIKLHRTLLEWEWYDDINTKVLFFHLLLKVNHAPGKWRGKNIGIGETLTGINVLSSETGLSIQKIRTALKKLKSTKEITINTTKNFSIIKVNNWEMYQESNTQNNKALTQEQQSSNTGATTNKKNKNNNKKENKNKYGEYNHVLLTLDQKNKFIEEFGENDFHIYIKKVDEYIQLSGKSYKDHNLVMRKFKNSDGGSSQKKDTSSVKSENEFREGL